MWRCALFGLPLVILAACSRPPAPAPSPEPKQEEPPAAETEKAAADAASPKVGISQFVGTWNVSEVDGKPLDVVLFPSGVAVSNWTEGEEGARGEFGQWIEEKGSVVVTYESGWRDILEKQGDAYLKKSYAPGTSLDGPASNTGAAKRLTGPVSTFVGVWQGKDANGKPLFYIAVKSDQTARKSNNPEALGMWTPVEGKPTAAIEWSDGSFNAIKQIPEGFLIEIWKPGSARNGPPDNSMPISMVQEAPPQG